ncbi:ferredoxin [Melanomma pulvis-pyrius CBS 109.77]|uniref:Ferredoxin n=1 Tax=Melanomma pulvis-pyrius CBS 109.77 TaxID=1314802 RepID=A0A6A6XBI9_9PLEO|nr:ferredoxin [Melanomma pulvis-pyrius CBS 109.77]
MVGAGKEKALLRALARPILASPPSRPASTRIHRFYSNSRNWVPSTLTRHNLAAGKGPQLSRPSPNTSLAIPSAFIRDQRAFSSTPVSRHGHLDPPKPGEERKITFIDKDGDAHVIEVADGDNLLDIAMANDIEMEGACGGSCACSTCHVIVQSDHYDVMDEPDDDENDMLDQAFGLTETSRLGCQVKMSKELDGLVVRLPLMTKNLQASDFENR